MGNDRSDKGPKGRDAIEEIARRLGGLVETVQDAIKTGGDSSEGGRDFKIDTPLGPLSGRYSMSVKSALGGSRASPPGAVRRKPAEEPAANPTVREPMIDAFDEPDAVVVTADIPGLRLEDVFISCEPGHLVLKISGATPFTRRIPFSILTTEHSPRVRMANGILEIRVNKDLTP
jgi:HSP20 family protein